LLVPNFSLALPEDSSCLKMDPLLPIFKPYPSLILGLIQSLS
jgi:hypothetical protein